MQWYSGKKIYLRRINNFIIAFGINLKKIVSLKNLIRFFFELNDFKKKGGKIRNLYPILDDYKAHAGEIKNYLFHADLLTSQYVFENNPKRHLDIGSRIDGLVSHIASFRELDVMDIRNLDITPHKNINFIKSDLTEFKSYTKKYDSISSIGVIAHIGLGRYNDKIDPDGHLKAITKISELMEVGGTLYLLFPAGKVGVEFNSHRVLDIEKIIEFSLNCNLKIFELHIVNDHGSLILNANVEAVKNCNFGGAYCVFKKI